MRKKIKLENKFIIYGILITLIPLILSYGFFIDNKLKSVDERIKNKLKEVGFIVSDTKFIKDKLKNRDFDYSIQEYTKKLIANVQDIDIVVVADMTGKKYSHLDENQVGDIYVNDDKQEVLEKGTSYYSIMVGSMGKTLRWFEPIYDEGKQIGFVMVGKYYKDIQYINNSIKLNYAMLFLVVFGITIIISKLFSKRIKKLTLGMEPENITRLYIEKKAIIDSVQEGIIALDEKHNVIELNKKCEEILENFSLGKVLEKLKKYIELEKDLQMKEFIIDKTRIFVTINTIQEDGEYLGCVIILNDRSSIDRIAKEITGVDEIVKNLRANVHEFKNNLHVILGLINLKEFEEATKYILKIQKMQEFKSVKFSNIEDHYVRSILISRELIAKERKVKFNLKKDSFLFGSHGSIDSNDITTILGNLIENAFEACAMKDEEDKWVDVELEEDEKQIDMIVTDNGIAIDKDIKENIFVLGISSKGENRGTGLALVKNRVDLYDGTIEINERKGEKAFHITIYKGE